MVIGKRIHLKEKEFGSRIPNMELTIANVNSI